MKLPLKFIFIVPFVLEIVTIVGIVGYLCLKNGEKAVNDLANQLMSETGSRLELYLHHYLSIPPQINYSNANLVKTGILDLSNLPELEKQLFSQLIQFSEVTTIMYGNQQGIFRALYRNNFYPTNNQPELQISFPNPVNVNILDTYRLDEQGNILDLFESYPFSFQAKPWYQDAINKKKIGWSQVFQIGQTKDLSINNYLPVYQSNQFLGVFSVNLSLQGISNYLNSIKLTPSSQIFIIEPDNNLLIARSDGKTTYQYQLILNEENQADKYVNFRRLYPQETDNDLIVITASYIKNKFNNLQNINQEHQINFSNKGECFYAQIKPFKDEHGLEWLVITVIPKSDFMAKIYANTHQTVILCFVSLIMAIVLGIVTANYVVKPIVRLNEASKSIGQGNWHQNIPINRQDEIGELATSFNLMSQKILQDFETLEIRVEERTKELAIAKEKAEVANQAKSVFIANMSHELRTPLNAILGLSQIMFRSPTLPEEDRENIVIINQSGNYLLNLINNILDLSKIEAGKMTLNPQNFELYSLLHEVKDLLQLKAENKSLQFLFELADNLPRYINTDETKLRQILINLLNNAIKFTEEGGVWLKVRSEVKDINIAILRFEVEDTGLGMTPDELNQLFEPFVQTATGKQYQEGTGLGLSISHKFVQLMGGNIWVKSQIGKGTTFFFDIVANVINEPDIVTTQSSCHIIALKSGQPFYKILIVDDRPINRLLLVELLQPLGFQLKEASNGQEAIAIWDTWQPHLIFMDMRMPVMNGYDATQYIKGKIKGNATAIIALTASVLEEEQAIVLSGGCDDFIRKPFRESAIFEAIAKHLGTEYIYEQEIEQVDTRRESHSLTAEDLRVMPENWLEQLYQASIQLDDDRIIELIKEIPESHSLLANQLSNLVDNFQLKQIKQLLENS